MGKDYFKRIKKLTPTRLWINNPTPEEAKKAIAAGAISCTTNPTYCMKQIQANSEKNNVFKIIDEILKDIEDNKEAANFIQKKLVKKILDIFLPVYENNPGKEGFVSIQSDPSLEDDVEHAVDEVIGFRKLGKNFIAKIPVTKSGLKVLEVLITENIPVIATEVMGVSQAVYTCEMYQKVSKKCGKTPLLYLTHITGILDDYLKKIVKRDRIDISNDVLWQAGCIVARKQYEIFKERKYPGIMLGGGARGLHHFTEMVGSEMNITINWSTANELIELDPPVVYRMFNTAPEKVIEELLNKIPDFKKAYFEDGLTLEEFKDFGPVNHFRDQFLNGWEFLLNIIKERR